MTDTEAKWLCTELEKSFTLRDLTGSVPATNTFKPSEFALSLTDEAFNKPPVLTSAQRKQLKACTARDLIVATQPIGGRYCSLKAKEAEEEGMIKGIPDPAPFILRIYFSIMTAERHKKLTELYPGGYAAFFLKLCIRLGNIKSPEPHGYVKQFEDSIGFKRPGQPSPLEKLSIVTQTLSVPDHQPKETQEQPRGPGADCCSVS